MVGGLDCCHRFVELRKFIEFDTQFGCVGEVGPLPRARAMVNKLQISASC